MPMPAKPIISVSVHSSTEGVYILQTVYCITGCTMGMNSDRTDAAGAGMLLWALAAALVMVIMLSVLAGMVMGIGIFDNQMMFAVMGISVVSLIPLAILLKN